jgi:hypothetical protein
MSIKISPFIGAFLFVPIAHTISARDSTVEKRY